MTPRKIKSPLSWQSRVNQLLQLNKGCWAANRDVYLSIELRDGVKICLTFLASSVSWVSGSWGRRQRGPRRRNRQGNNTAAAPSNECDAPGGEPPKRSLGGFERNSYQGEPFLFVLAYQGKTSPQRSTRRASAPPGNLFVPQCLQDVVETNRPQVTCELTPLQSSFGLDETPTPVANPNPPTLWRSSWHRPPWFQAWRSRTCYRTWRSRTYRTWRSRIWARYKCINYISFSL